MTDRVIIWCPAGRRANMELLLPFLRRILAENPETELHIWDVARRPDDHAWLGTVWGERITLIGDFYGYPEREAFVEIYRHYADEAYKDALFVKVDDDIVFIETKRFPQFVGAIRAYPDAIVSADTINNGACATLEPRLAAMFPDMESIALEAYQSADFARASHDWFFDELPVIDAPMMAFLVKDWLSINLVGWTWATGANLSARLGQKPPDRIAGRRITQKRMGDEGAANTMRRIVLQGFTAAHLSFGPQHKQLPESYWQETRKQYQEIGKQYLETP